MDFALDPESELVRKLARDFALENFDKKFAQEIDKKEEFPWELYKKAANHRLLRPSIPEEYGGGGMNTICDVIVREEFTRVDSTLGQAILSGGFGSKLIYMFGSEKQRRKYLKKVLDGDATMYAAFTEPDHGSDITKLSTTARRSGDKWVINGTKTFITNSPTAEFGIVLCQVEPWDGKPHRNQAMFIVESDMQGVKVTPQKNKLGQRGSPIGEIKYTNVELTDEYVLGEVGKGFYQALKFFTYGRVGVAANAIGMMLNAFDRALEYSKGRTQFGTPIIQFQAVSHKLAVMGQFIEASRLLTYRAAWALDRDDIGDRVKGIYSAMAKRYSSEAAWKVIDMALQIFGGYGYMGDFDVERILRDARILRIYEGTNEILNEVIIGGLKRGDLKL